MFSFKQNCYHINSYVYVSTMYNTNNSYCLELNINLLPVVVMTPIEFVRGPSPAPVLHETSIM